MGRSRSPQPEYQTPRKPSGRRFSFRHKSASNATLTTAASSHERDRPGRRYSLNGRTPRRSIDRELIRELERLDQDEFDESDEEPPLNFENLVITGNNSGMIDDDGEMSQITMQTKDFIPRSMASLAGRDQRKLNRLTSLMGECEAIISEADSESFSESTGNRKMESNALFTFQRANPKDSSKMFSTTLSAKTYGCEDTMEDLVKRLQKMGNTSSVLRFEKDDILAIKSGKKQVVFALTQVQGAVFNKQEFGKMTVTEMLDYTDERPVLIQISTEDIIDGESIDVF